MWRIGGDTWGFSGSTNPEVAFCVWSLLRDGLRVQPFEAHPDGDGSLRSPGLTAADWQGWFSAVVGAMAAFEGKRRSEYIEGVESHWREKRVPPTEQKQRELSTGYLARGPQAVDLWEGRAAVRYALAEQRRVYADERAQREEQERDLVERTLQNWPAEERGRPRLWDEIQRYRPLPPLFFYLVDYPEPVLSVVPPAAAVLGGIHPVPRIDPAYESLVLQAAAQLAGLGPASPGA